MIDPSDVKGNYLWYSSLSPVIFQVVTILPKGREGFTSAFVDHQSNQIFFTLMLDDTIAPVVVLAIFSMNSASNEICGPGNCGKGRTCSPDPSRT